MSISNWKKRARAQHYKSFFFDIHCIWYSNISHRLGENQISVRSLATFKAPWAHNLNYALKNGSVWHNNWHPTCQTVCCLPWFGANDLDKSDGQAKCASLTPKQLQTPTKIDNKDNNRKQKAKPKMTATKKRLPPQKRCDPNTLQNENRFQSSHQTTPNTTTGFHYNQAKHHTVWHTYAPSVHSFNDSVQ